MNSRALVAIAVGITGLALGILAAVQGSSLAIFSGIAALGAGIIGVVYSRSLQETERQLEVEKQQSAGLEQTVTSQVQARITAEDAVRSLGDELAATQATEQARTERIEEEIKKEAQDDSGNSRQLIKDSQTGLFTETYFRAAVEARVAAARRHLRPVSVVLLEANVGPPGNRTPADPSLISSYLLSTLRESDTACRTSKGLYALVLEDTPENGAVWTVERIRRKISEDDHKFTIWAGVASYPAHAFEVRDLVGKASEALDAATEWHQDRIEVAIPDL